MDDQILVAQCTKKCTKCGGSDAGFSGRSSWCKACVCEYSKAHYLRTSTPKRRYDGSFSSKTYHHERYRKYKEQLAVLKQRPCLDCGQQFPSMCMEFDHVREGKQHNLASMYNHRPGAVRCELSLCEVVCVCCHRSRTAARRPPMRHTGRYAAKTQEKLVLFHAWMTFLKNNPCTDCGGRFSSEAMDFDHVRGEKVTEISAMWSWGRDLALAELAKTELVCACCHRLRTETRRGQKAA